MHVSFACRALSPLLLVSVIAWQGAPVHAQRGSALGGQQTRPGGVAPATPRPFNAAGGQAQLGSGQGGLGPASLGQRAQSQFGQLGQRGQAQQRVGGQDGFVGSDAQQVRNQAAAGRASRRAMFDFAVESLNEMRAARAERRARQNAPAPVRVQLRPLFAVRQRSALELNTQVSRQLQRSLPPSLAATTQVSIRGDTATIEGTVSSAYDKQLAAKMISLQPGIAQIENQLVIDASRGAAPSIPLR